MKRLLLVATLLTLHAVRAPGQECRMSLAFMQPDQNARGRATPVWADAGNSSLFFIESLNVNTDGTRRSYSVPDFWGQTNALNNLCNAMSDSCSGLDTAGLRNRRLITQRAFALGWPAAELRQTRISPAIIPFKDGKPCPNVGDFLVSATALHKPVVTDVCDISNYIDALDVAAFVLPKNPPHGISGFAARQAGIGDLVVAMLPGGTTPVYAVVGDLGPARELGEGSIALNGRLLGRTEEPRNYTEVLGRPPFRGRGWQVPRALVLVFPATRDRANPFMTTPRINEEAMRRFQDWGGVERLNSCARDYGMR